MNTQIGALHFDADIKLRDLITEKTNSLEKLFDRIESCKVILKLEKNKNTENKVVEMSVSVPHSQLFAKDKAETFEEAVQLTIDELKQQLKKYKTKMGAY
ncbi:MAG: ribosome-associated translation inhibitor RaiA [bacterium]|nr:ribosome-associated translation inhibitor RaiA [bacterium]